MNTPLTQTPTTTMTTIMKFAKIEQALAEAVEAIGASGEGQELDAEFDGGEFSGPAHGRMLDTKLDEIALRNGLTRDQLDMLLQYEKLDEAYKAVRIKREAYVCRECHGLTDAAGAYLRDGAWRCAGCGETWPKPAPTPAQTLAGLWHTAHAFGHAAGVSRCDAIEDCARALGIGDEFEREVTQ